MTGPFPTNRDIAERLDEVGRLMGQQDGHRFRVRAYHRAAATVRALPRPIDDLFAEGGLEALEALPGAGESLARSIAQVLVMGRLPMLDRLRGESQPTRLFQTVPGIGPVLARRIHEELGVETLEELEVAAHDGRLERMGGIGVKRLTGIRDSLAHRLARVRRFPPRGVTPEPGVAELLDVDREYRQKVATEDLPRISPRRFNPRGEAWLPILHTKRGNRSYTVLWSNTARPRAGEDRRLGDPLRGRARRGATVHGDHVPVRAAPRAADRPWSRTGVSHPVRIPGGWFGRLGSAPAPGPERLPGTPVKLTFLGTREEVEARSDRHRRHSSLRVDYRGRRVVIDSGADWRGALAELASQAVILTHAHADHAGGLADGTRCAVHATDATWRSIDRFPIRDRSIVDPRHPFRIGRSTSRRSRSSTRCVHPRSAIG